MKTSLKYIVVMLSVFILSICCAERAFCQEMKEGQVWHCKNSKLNPPTDHKILIEEVSGGIVTYCYESYRMIHRVDKMDDLLAVCKELEKDGTK